MGKMEIAAGPSSQALTGNKKYSSKLGDDSWEFGEKPRAVCGASRHGCFGIPWADVRLLAAALVVLYIFLGLFYWGLITGAQEVRQEEWLELGDRFFGSFSKIERPLLNSTNQPIPKGRITIAEFDNLRDAQQGEFQREYNRANGCRPVTNAAGAQFLECDRDNGEDGLWALFPWVSDKIASGDLNIPGCAFDGEGRRTWSSLEQDGSYGNEANSAAAPEALAVGPNTCLSYVTVSAISQ